MARRGLAIELTAGEQEELRELLKSGLVPARSVIRALALLRMNSGMNASQVAPLLELTPEGVRQIGLRYRAGGWEAAVHEGARPGKKPALDEGQKQKVVALVCGPPPTGFARWSVRLLTAEVKKQKILPGVGREVIRIALQDHDLKPWREKNVVRSRA